MKKYIILLLAIWVLSCVAIIHAEDRVRVQVQFRKAYWICPKCGQEDITDLNVGTPSVYEHNCSKCDQWFNNFREYNGILSYPKDEYETVKKEDIDKEKKERIDAWLHEIKHPPIYVEPDKETLIRMRDDKLQEVDELQRQIDEKDITR